MLHIPWRHVWHLLMPSRCCVFRQCLTSALAPIASQMHALAHTIPAPPLPPCSIGAHARALQCYESHVRGLHGGAGVNPAAHTTSHVYAQCEVSFLLEVYAQLDEPDGLAGALPSVGLRECWSAVNFCTL
jgi:hypothetical protein